MYKTKHKPRSRKTRQLQLQREKIRDEERSKRENGKLKDTFMPAQFIGES